MKRLIILMSITVFLGCNESNKKEDEVKKDDSASVKTDKPLIDSVRCEGRNMGKYKTYSRENAGIMADLYRDLVFEDYHNAIRQISLDPATLNSLLCDIIDMKLIGAAEDGNVSLLLEYVIAKNDNYYDMEQIFGDGILCPPPTDCGIPLIVKKKAKGDSAKVTSLQSCVPVDMSKYTKYNLDQVKAMAKRYIDIIKDDHRQLIQQVKFMDPQLLSRILCDAEGFKLIAAAREDKTITMVLEYGRAGETSFYDLISIFPDALCPPPDNCGIPYTGPSKNDKSKRPKQK